MMAHTAKQDSKPNNSLWASGADEFFASKTSNNQYDVAIIGGGFSGLWSAFHLLHQKPDLKIAVFEAKQFGFGASGRNGGWASSDYPVYRKTLEKRYGQERTANLFQALASAIDEIGEFCRVHAPNAHFEKSGTVMFARNQAQEKRLQAASDEMHQWIDKSQLDKLLRVKNARGALFNPVCATVNPIGIIGGLLRYLQSRDVHLFEHSLASVVKGGVLVNSSFIEAQIVIQATEVFGSANRDFIPLYSQMVATEPLSDQIWQEIGAQTRLTFAEGSHLINYAQRTSDNRLAIGGRGATYPFSSKLVADKEMTAKVHENLRQLARSWFPQISTSRFTHAWGGAVAITRNWEPYVQFNSATGFGRLGGYAGDGVTMSYLASKIMAKLIFNENDLITNLHFVNQKIRQWEIEPLRYLAVNSMVKLSGFADKEESITGRPSLVSKIISPLILR